MTPTPEEAEAIAVAYFTRVGEDVNQLIQDARHALNRTGGNTNLATAMMATSAMKVIVAEPETAVPEVANAFAVALVQAAQLMTVADPAPFTIAAAILQGRALTNTDSDDLFLTDIPLRLAHLLDTINTDRTGLPPEVYFAVMDLVRTITGEWSTRDPK